VDASHYEERTGAPVFLWILVEILSLSLAIAYGAAAGIVWGVGALVITQGLGLWWLLAMRARIAVDDGVLVAGRARLPVRFVGAVTALDPDGARYLGGPGADARAFLLLRGSGLPAVRVNLDDPADPTPYWLITTRRPDALRDALLAAKAAAPGPSS